MFEGILIVNFPPTSENLSEWMFNIVQSKMKNLGVNTDKIDWWETPKSKASYTCTTKNLLNTITNTEL